MSITSRVEEITPQRAKALSERLFAHSRPDGRLIDSYAADIRSGRWMLNGAPLVISADGEVLDGRLRILACIAAAVPFTTLVVEGIQTEAFETIDAVRKRSLADVLAIRNEKHGRAMGAALRIIWAYRQGSTPGAGKAPPPLALLGLLEQFPEIRDSVLPALRASPLLPHGCAIALHYLFGKVDSRKADLFMAMVGGVELDDPSGSVSQLRAVLQDLKGQGGTRKQSYMLAVAIKAWNAFHLSRQLKQLRYNPDRESFPQISGALEWGPLGTFAEDSERRKDEQRARQCAGVTARLEMVTPDMAQNLLSRGGPNRHVSGVVINKYARDMAEGRWLLNGQTIKFGRSGQLLDGQHRLEAAKKSGAAFPAIIVEGLAEETFASLDIGKRRATSDILRERGETSTIVLASALRWLWMLKNDVLLAANTSPTNGELTKLLEENPDIRHSLKAVGGIREIMGGGIASALHHVFREKDADLAGEFFKGLIDGQNLNGDSPIYHLRERLIRTRASHRVRLAEAERVALTIKAWNAFRSGRPMQLLTWRNRGAGREGLPVAV